MADDTYVIDTLVKAGQPVPTIVDADGVDWLTFQGIYPNQTSIRLAWINDDSGHAIAAAGSYETQTVGERLVITGVIENARGSDGSDYIQGNELANILYGDQSADGAGAADTIEGNAGDDTIYGGAGDDILRGMEGNDTIYGGTGNDDISGGDGVDLIEGGAGADILYGGGDAGDTVSYASSSAAVAINITYGSATTGVGGDAQGDTIGGFTDVVGSAFDDVITDTRKETVAYGYNDNEFFGGGGNDRLYLGGGNDVGWGGEGNDFISGEIGNDSLYGDNGNDVLIGGSGADKLYGGAGTDTASYAGATKGVTANLGASRLNAGDAKGDTYSSIENLTGSSKADILTGNKLANTISGGSGNDVLNGGLGKDVLIGGGGKDIFQFTTKLGSTNIDRIDDFAVKADVIVLDDDIFKKIGKVGDLDDDAFYIGRKAHDASDRIVYDKASGKLWYDADGSGAGKAVQFATLDHGLKLTADNFDIIA